MSNTFRDDEQTVLIAELRREAEASRPKFSAVLHERLCRAVRTNKATVAIAPRPAAHRRKFAWSIVAASAVCLAAGLAVAWQSGWLSWPQEQAIEFQVAEENGAAPTIAQSAAPQETAHDFEKMAALVDEVTEQVGKLVESTISEQQFAYLDHDAGLALRGLAQALPFELPEGMLAWSEPGDVEQR